jgi:hypothetical protein
MTAFLLLTEQEAVAINDSFLLIEQEAFVINDSFPFVYRTRSSCCQ